METNRRGFLKLLVQTILGLFSWKLPIFRPEAPVPAPEHDGWFHACTVFTKVTDRQVFLHDCHNMTVSMWATLPSVLTAQDLEDATYWPLIIDDS